MDLMEACRPEVDRYTLRMFQNDVFRSSDFHETSRGVCQIMPSLTHRLGETALVWARAIAPIAEQIARMLGKPRRIRNRTSSLGRHPSATGSAGACRSCGSVTSSRVRKYCRRVPTRYRPGRFPRAEGGGHGAASEGTRRLEGRSAHAG
jgi:hypothetical protein